MCIRDSRRTAAPARGAARPDSRGSTPPSCAARPTSRARAPPCPRGRAERRRRTTPKRRCHRRPPSSPRCASRASCPPSPRTRACRSPSPRAWATPPASPVASRRARAARAADRNPAPRPSKCAKRERALSGKRDHDWFGRGSTSMTTFVVLGRGISDASFSRRLARRTRAGRESETFVSARASHEHARSRGSSEVRTARAARLGAVGGTPNDGARDH